MRSFGKRSLRRTGWILAAVAYGAFVSCIDILFGLDNSQIKDRVNYHAYSDLAYEFIGKAVNENIVAFVFSEPLFLIIMSVFSILLTSPELVVRVVVFFSASLSSLAILSNSLVGPAGRIAVLIFPWYLVNYVMTLRLGIALALFLAGYYLLPPRARLTVFAITPLIHYSFIFVLAMVALAHMLKTSRFATDVRLFCFAAFAAVVTVGVIGVVYGGASIPVKEFQQLAERYNTDFNIYLGPGLFFWAAIGVLMVGEGKVYVNSNLAPVGAVLFYVLTVVFFPPISRIMQVWAPIVLLSAFQVSGVRAHVVQVLVAMYLVYFWMLSIYNGAPLGMVTG